MEARRRLRLKSDIQEATSSNFNHFLREARIGGPFAAEGSRKNNRYPRKNGAVRRYLFLYALKVGSVCVLGLAYVGLGIYACWLYTCVSYVLQDSCIEMIRIEIQKLAS